MRPCTSRYRVAQVIPFFTSLQVDLFKLTARFFVYMSLLGLYCQINFIRKNKGGAYAIVERKQNMSFVKFNFNHKPLRTSVGGVVCGRG